MHKTTFRIIKNSSWGIVIRLECDVNVTNGVSDIELNLSNVEWLSDKEKDCLNYGLDIVRDSLKVKLRSNEALIVTVKAIDFNPCDYQPEGLTWALVQWVNEVYSLNVHYSEVNFNKNIGQYEFKA